MIEPGQIVRARDWENIEGKMFLVQELIDGGDWGACAWLTTYEPDAEGAPISRVIPLDRLTIDEEETARYQEWRAQYR
jgi:hypothetical protein